MVKSANLGFPRIGAFRELKKAQEAYWKGNIEQSELLEIAADLRIKHWKLQQDAGIDIIPSNDFSFYDQMLDTICMVGAVPERYGYNGGRIDLDTYFAMARGRQTGGIDVVAMEMTKWFDTNYHYIVPEFNAETQFLYASQKAVEQFIEAKEQGINTRPVLIGPVTFLSLGKSKDGSDPIALLPQILPIYSEVLSDLEEAGATDVQIDEPILVLDLSDTQKDALKQSFAALSDASGLNITLATYFGSLDDNIKLASELPVAALHIDIVRGQEQFDAVLNSLPEGKTLSVGVVEGRNIWKNDLQSSIDKIEKAVSSLGSDRIVVAPSCSLLHSPVDLDNEKKLDAEIKSWLSFAKQKLQEVSIIATAINEGKGTVIAELGANKEAVESRKNSKRIHVDEVKQRVADISQKMLDRANAFDKRVTAQRNSLGLPLLPTTTIGSFPQTQEVRKQRAAFKKGDITLNQYDKFLEEETIHTIKFQDKVGLDMPVHGEFERNDMVEYFGEQLEGFAFTSNGWVQSYGSRCVKPPVIFGDVSRPEPMTVRWSKFAQEQTDRPVKGMLTGPITILQWSFVRDDQPREVTCKQIGLAIRDEVVDLEAAGIKAIQIDEPAIREGLPLRRDAWNAYLRWAVDSFRLSAAGVRDETQIHTHMCYSEFNDIMNSIAEMDADVISIETSRSDMELLDAFVKFKYPNEIGPGVYDIHSPRVPSKSEMTNLLKKALDVLSPEQLWVNPDCGLKTRGWPEVEEALLLMVDAAKDLRTKLEGENKAA